MRAYGCDSCGTLFKPVEGTVSLEYSVLIEGSSYQGFTPDENSDNFYLCAACSEIFKKFIKHDE